LGILPNLTVGVAINSKGGTGETQESVIQKLTITYEINMDK